MKKITFLIAMIFVASGCSMEASLEDITAKAVTQEAARTTGLVSGSTQSSTTTGGTVTYHVQSTLGNYMSGITQQTSDGKYKVYSSVQGEIVSN